ncbi:MAG: phosphatidylserine decarboxylase [Blautia sp.]|jgi:phosphatidylserine decarboxylase
MKYIDRKGNVTAEENGQDKFLRHLYQDWGGKLLLGVLTRPFVSVFGGLLLNLPVSAMAVPGFVRRNHISMEDYEEQKYHSYNEFFTRRIKKGRRPIASGPGVLISPCDGKVTVSVIEKDSTFWIKGRRYTLGDLLRDQSLARRFCGGYAYVIRLTVDDYHRYCYPADGVQSSIRRIKGRYHTVNPAANEACPIYSENTREYALLQTMGMGTFLMMEVGAMLVGKITNLYPMPRLVHKGQEKGYFEFGGSTVVLLTGPDGPRPDSDLLEYSREGYEIYLKMGEQIGKQDQLSKKAGRSDR